MARHANCCGGGSGGNANVDDYREGEHIILCDKRDDGEIVPFMRHIVYDANGLVDSTLDTELDGETAFTIEGEIDICAGDEYNISVGWIQNCKLNRSSANIQNNIEVSDNTANPRTLIFETTTDLAVFSGLVQKQLIVQEEQQRVGVAETTILLTTSEGVYEFFPQNIVYNGLTVEIPIANVVTWQINGVDEHNIAVTSDQLIDCACEQVELIQRFNAVTDEMILVQIVRPTLDANSIKEEVALPLGFGQTWGFGQCREERVVSIEPLCCSDDIESDNPDVFGTFFMNPDADGTLWQNVAGTVAAVNDGDDVERVDSNVIGGEPFELVPLDNLGRVNTAPTLRTNRINGRPVLEFDGVNDALTADFGAITQGDPFTLVFLFSGEPDIIEHASIISSDDATKVQNFLADNSWQLCRGAASGNLVDYFNIPAGLPQDTTTDYFVLRYARVNPIAGFTTNYDVYLANVVDVFDSSPHLVTMNYDGRFVDIYIDGNRVLTKWDMFTTGGNHPVDNDEGFRSGYYKIFRNRGNDSSPEGEFMEFVFTEQVSTDEELSYINGYLMCKWAIDASQIVGNVPLEVPVRAYGQATEFVRRVMADGTIEFLNILTDRVYVYPPYGGLGYCQNSPSFVDSLLPNEGNEFETLEFSDGEHTQFIRTYVYNAANPDIISSFFDTTPDGTPFTPVQPIRPVVGARLETVFAVELLNGAAWTIPANTTFIRARAWDVASMSIEFENGNVRIFNVADGWIEIRAQDGSILTGQNFEITGIGGTGAIVHWTELS